MDGSAKKVLACCALLLTTSLVAEAAKRHPANVPPTDEIEVISPGVDPLDRPSAVLKDGPDGEQIVEIPPTVLVHKYYYTGDRSFQAQLLPGGPCIVVVSHPKTGERCYIEVQLMPGAPLVTYTAHGIEYDYGEHGITLAFRHLTGKPIVKYRNGLRLDKKVGKVVHAQQVWQHTKDVSVRVKNTTGGVVVQAGRLVNTAAIQPVKQFAGLLPFGRAIFGGDLEDQLTQTYLQHKGDHEVKRFQEQAKRDAADVPTIR